MTAPRLGPDRLALLDWRRRVHALYAQVRARYTRDPADAHRHWVEVRNALFANHPSSPIPAEAREGFTGLAHHAYDPAFAFTARVDTDVAPERWEVATSAATTMTYERVGVIDLPIGRLDVLWLDDYAGGIFVPLRDATAGQETYGGGRYLLDTPKGADLGATPDGALLVDLNFAYHPSCHYDPAYSCPLAPPGSRLEARVEAGELAWNP